MCMKRVIVSVLLSCSLLLGARAEGRLIDYVNPFVGTTNYGTTNPGARLPHGLMSVTPLM